MRFTPFDCFAYNLGCGVHDLRADSLKLLLVSGSVSPATTGRSSLQPIPSSGGYPFDGYDLPGRDFRPEGGRGVLRASDLTVRAYGGSIGPFQHVVLYNATLRGSPLIGFLSHDEPITLRDGDMLVIPLAAPEGLVVVGG